MEAPILDKSIQWRVPGTFDQIRGEPAMRWVAIFDDRGGFDSIRKEHSAEHFDYFLAMRR
jgi:hypothetical protein